MKNRRPVAISGFGVVSFLGEGSRLLDRLEGDGAQTPATETVEPGLDLPLGRLGRLRRHHFRERFERMTQLDAFSQYAFVASGHALDDAGIPAPDPRFEEVGVLLGTAFGCQEANSKFDQFALANGGPENVRPAVFKHTVDNVPAGWVALGYQLRGINATFVSGPGAGAEAMLTAVWVLEDGRARHVLAGGVERLLPMQIAAQHRRSHPPVPFMSEGAAAILFELQEAAEARQVEARDASRTHLVAATRLPAPSSSQIVEWLDGADCAPESIDVTSLVALSAAEQDSLGQLLAGAGLDKPPRIESRHTGQMFAAQAPLALMLLVERLRHGEGRSGLLMSAGEGGEVFLFLVALR